MKRAVVATLAAIGLVAYLALGWVVGLVVALVGVFSLLREIAALKRELRPALTCPRGHRVPTYGRVACASCGFVTEGSVWRCRRCDARYGHTPCPTCGLSVEHPGRLT